MFIPPIEINGSTIFLHNFLTITDQSTSRKTRVLCVSKNGGKITYEDDAADDLLDELERILNVADTISLPIIGVGKQFLIIPNFILSTFENTDGEPTKLTLTSDYGDEFEYEGDHAYLIQARIEAFAEQTRGFTSVILDVAQKSKLVN